MLYGAKFLLIFLIAALVVPFAFANAESASKQFQNGTPINEIQCDNPSHILVERNNGNPACVTERTAEKLGWAQIIQVDVTEESHSAKSPQIVGDTVTPILNPSVEQIKSLVLPDNRITNLVEIYDEDAFVNNLLDLYDDTLIEKKYRQQSNDYRYETEKGWILFDDNPHSYFTVEYTLFGKHRIPERLAEEYTFEFIEKIGLTPEIVGQPHHCDDPRYCNYTFIFSQVNEESNPPFGGGVINTWFYPSYTRLFVDGWYVNYADIELYDFNKARENAKNYLNSINELHGPNCNVSYDDASVLGHESLTIINNRLIYDIYSGMCETPYADGHYHWYAVFVDAVTGEPLYAKNKMTF